MKPKVSVRRARDGHVRITITRGAVTTDATLTEAEAACIWAKLDRLLNATAGPRKARAHDRSRAGGDARNSDEFVARCDALYLRSRELNRVGIDVEGR